MTMMMYIVVGMIVLVLITLKELVAENKTTQVIEAIEIKGTTNVRSDAELEPT